MSNPKKAKGTLAETGLVNYLQDNGFPHAERRALAGVNDLGDIIGTVGICWEVKNQKTYNIPKWLKETQIETKNSNSDYGVLVVKPNGIGPTRPDQWWAIMNVEDIVRLLRDAGYGTPNKGE